MIEPDPTLERELVEFLGLLRAPQGSALDTFRTEDGRFGVSVTIRDHTGYDSAQHCYTRDELLRLAKSPSYNLQLLADGITNTLLKRALDSRLAGPPRSEPDDSRVLNDFFRCLPSIEGYTFAVSEVEGPPAFVVTLACNADGVSVERRLVRGDVQGFFHPHPTYAPYYAGKMAAELMEELQDARRRRRV